MSVIGANECLGHVMRSMASTQSLWQCIRVSLFSFCCRHSLIATTRVLPKRSDAANSVRIVTAATCGKGGIKSNRNALTWRQSCHQHRTTTYAVRGICFLWWPRRPLSHYQFYSSTYSQYGCWMLIRVISASDSLMAVKCCAQRMNKERRRKWGTKLRQMNDRPQLSRTVHIIRLISSTELW